MQLTHNKLSLKSKIIEKEIINSTGFISDYIWYDPLLQITFYTKSSVKELKGNVHLDSWRYVTDEQTEYKLYH